MSLMRKLFLFLLLLSSLGHPVVVSATQVFQAVYLQDGGSVPLTKQIKKWIPEKNTDDPELVFKALRDGKFQVDQELRINPEEQAWYAFRYYVEPGFSATDVWLRFIVTRFFRADIYVLDEYRWNKYSLPDFSSGSSFVQLQNDSYAAKLPISDSQEYWVLIKPYPDVPLSLKTELTTESAYYKSIFEQQMPGLLASGAVLAMMLLVLSWKWRNPSVRCVLLVYAAISVFSRFLHFGYFPALTQMFWFDIAHLYTALFVLQQIFFLVLVMWLVDIEKEVNWLKFLSWFLLGLLVLQLPLEVIPWGSNQFIFVYIRILVVMVLILEFVLVIRAVLLGRDVAGYLILATVASFGIISFQVWQTIGLLQSEILYLIIRETTFSLMFLALTIAVLRYKKRKKDDATIVASRQSIDIYDAWVSDIYTLSQELRTPTTGVIGMAQLLQRGGLDKSQRHYANVIVSSANEIVDTLGAVLDITRIHAKKFHLDSVQFSIEQLFQFLADFFEFDVSEVESHINGRFSEKMPIFFVGDQVRLQEIMAISMRTLLRFTSERLGVNITADDQVGASERLLRFVIEAKDIRLSQEARQRFVEILKNNQEGAMLFGGARGSAELGLVLVNKIVREMGGQIQMDVGSGRSVSIWFTVKLQVDNNRQLKFSRDQAQLRNKRVALIYSSAMFAENVAQHFLSWGMDAQVINDNGDWQVFDFEDYDILALSNASKWPVASILERAAEKNIPVLLSDGLSNNQLSITDFPVMRIAYVAMGSTLSDMTGAMVNLLLNRDVEAINRRATKENRFEQFKVLLAEDNLVNQQVIMAMLRNLGVDAEYVSDGSEVLSKIFDRPEYYDLILMDYEMPQMNGVETARALRMRRRNSAFKPLTICCLTAHATSDVREECIAAGMDAVLVKPVNIVVLEDYLSSVFRRIDGVND